MEYKFVTSPEKPSRIGLRAEGVTAWFSLAHIEKELKRSQAMVFHWEKVREEIQQVLAAEAV